MFKDRRPKRTRADVHAFAKKLLEVSRPFKRFLHHRLQNHRTSQTLRYNHRSNSLSFYLGTRSHLLTIFMAEEDFVDPKKYLEKRCQPKCVRPLYEYRECVRRIQSDKTGNKHCTGQYFDYWACIDKCVRWHHSFLKC